jgi:N-acylneuraminate cytidylyltransferase
VVPAAQNPHKMWRYAGADKPMRPLLEVDGIAEPFNAPRQALPPVYWQTGHIDAIRTASIRKKRSLTGDLVYPLLIDPRYTVDIDTLSDWAKYESLAYAGTLDIVSPRAPRRPMPPILRMIICDFDGVITDNRVWTDENGKESVAATRGDSMRLRDLRERGVQVMILSSEPNPVVQARAAKMGVEAVNGIDIRGKGEALRRLLAEKQVDAGQVIFIGNDLNDLPCFEIAGWAVAVADAAPEALRAADYILTRSGGHGAVRELCELVFKKIEESSHVA